ncbi:type II secretion system F family protein [Lachnospiraceae bacterium 54-53]
MIFLTAASGAVFSYLLIELCLSAACSRGLALKERLKAVEETGRRREGNGDLDIPLMDRIFKPVFHRILDVFSIFAPKNPAALEKLEQQLRQAGIPMNPQSYSAAAAFFTAFCVGTGIFCGRAGGGVQAVLYGIMGLYAGVVINRFHLKSRIKKRNEEIYHQLPEMMDLLSVSVSAGLGFDQALSYVVDKFKGALFDELDVTQREIALGRRRKEALNGFADRCENMEIRTFVTAVIQADEMGASMQNILSVQASAIRQTHKQNVEEKAQKLSVKILLPMVLFIFPVIFIVLMGPAVMSIMEIFGGE